MTTTLIPKRKTHTRISIIIIRLRTSFRIQTTDTSISVTLFQIHTTQTQPPPITPVVGASRPRSAQAVRHTPPNIIKNEQTDWDFSENANNPLFSISNKVTGLTSLPTPPTLHAVAPPPSLGNDVQRLLAETVRLSPNSHRCEQDRLPQSCEPLPLV